MNFFIHLFIQFSKKRLCKCRSSYLFLNEPTIFPRVLLSEKIVAHSLQSPQAGPYPKGVGCDTPQSSDTVCKTVSVGKKRKPVGKMRKNPFFFCLSLFAVQIIIGSTFCTFIGYFTLVYVWYAQIFRESTFWQNL